MAKSKDAPDDTEDIQKSNTAKVDIVTGEKRITMSTPVKEFDDLKSSFKNMMAAFANFIEAAGLEIGKDEASTRIETLRNEFEKFKDDVKAEEAKMRKELVPQYEFEKLKDDVKAEEAKMREELVPQGEFEKLKAVSEERAAKASENYVTRVEFDRFREAIREVI